MKKLNLFSVIIMVAGLITSSFVQGQSCDTLRNYDPSAPYYQFTSATGLILGHNEVDISGDTYQADAWAEPYTVSSATTVRALRVAPWKVQDNSGGGSITFQVFGDNAGTPSGVLGSQTVPIADFTQYTWKIIEFTTPVNVSAGNFHVGYILNYTTPADSFALLGTQPTTGVTKLRASGSGTLNGQWSDLNALYTLETAFYLDVLTSTGTPPTADFTITNTSPPCVGGVFDVNASASTGTIDTYTWSLSDDPYTQDFVEFDGSAIDNVPPSTSSPSNQVLWLITKGACNYDITGYYVDVLPEVDATVTAVDDNCSAGSGSISIAATGGDGTYLYSIDGGSTTSPTGTFNNLSAGTYNVEVTTTGNGCSYTETVTVGNIPGEVITVGSAQSICAGASATITASGTGTIEWFDGGTSLGTGTSIVVSPTSTKTYDATLTDANGCTDTKQVTVNVTPQSDATFAYTTNTICLGSPNQTPTLTEAGGLFTNTGTGLVFANTSTGEIDMTNSIAGTYDITYTITGTCGDAQTQSITITTSPNASFSYTNAAYCQSEGVVTPTFAMGASAGVFTSTAGLTIASGTGAINFSTSTPGVYTVTNTIAASGTCLAASATFNITVNATPAVNAGADQAVCEGTSVTLTATGAATYAWDNSVTNGTAFTPGVGTTVYTVTGTGSNSCEGTDQVSVVVTAYPTVNAGVDQTVCEGTDVTLIAAISTGTVSWDNGVTDGTAFTPTATTTYTVTGDNNGCTATDDVIVTVNPLPTVGAGSDQTTCVYYSAFALTGTPTGGTFSGNGVTGSNFDPGTAGEGTHTITYTFTDGNGCENSATIDITVDGCVGVDKNELNKLTVSPNPASDYIEVRVDENNTINNIQLMSLEGKVVPVVYTTVDNQTTQIDVSSVAKGTYFIQLSSEKGQLTRKVIVQ